jgi:hypothetical protein
MKFSVKKLRDAIIKARGNVSIVAKSFDVSRTTIYTHINKYPDVQQCLTDEREKMIDNVESALYNQALDGNTTAMIFFLKTQGKGRGYIERQELTGKDGEKLVVEVKYINSPVIAPSVSPEPTDNT